MSVRSHTQLPLHTDDATNECSTLRAPSSTIKEGTAVDADVKVSRTHMPRMTHARL
jgi:hypothetical protein